MPIHIKAEKQDVAPYVLLPGDPDRTKYIAEKFLEQPKQYTSYRQMFGFTGHYKGTPISVQTSGMGTPSASIIVNELFQLGVQAIIRVGTVGGLSPKLNLADMIIVNNAWSSREIVHQITQCPDFQPSASWDLLHTSVHLAKQTPGLRFHVGPVASVNLFYNPDEQYAKRMAELGCLGCEMEAAAVFALSAKYKRQAHCLLTVSDLIFDPEGKFVRASEEKILEGVDTMVKVALDSLVECHHQSKNNK